MHGDAAARRVETGPVPASSASTSPASRPRLHYAWIVAAVTFVTLLGAAGFRATPGVLIEPLEDDFGWSRGWISAAISVNLVLFGLVGPFAAALMNRFGLRPVVLSALVAISAGAALTTTMTSVWQLLVLWGVVVGTGSGCLATVLAATVATRWFVARRGLVIGVLTAATATGQIVFLPLLAHLADTVGWRWATVPPTVALCNECFGPDRGSVVFGWVFAGHQIGAAAIAWFAGVSHGWTGSYRLSFLLAGTLCLVAAVATRGIRGDRFQPSADDRPGAGPGGPSSGSSSGSGSGSGSGVEPDEMNVALSPGVAAGRA